MDTPHYIRSYCVRRIVKRVFMALALVRSLVFLFSDLSSLRGYFYGYYNLGEVTAESKFINIFRIIFQAICLGYIFFPANSWLIARVLLYFKNREKLLECNLRARENSISGSPGIV